MLVLLNVSRFPALGINLHACHVKLRSDSDCNICKDGSYAITHEQCGCGSDANPKADRRVKDAIY